MIVFAAIFHLIVVFLISILVSMLAMRAIRWSGTDLKDFKQRNRPVVLIIAGIFNILFIVAVELLLKYWDHQSLAILGFSLNSHNWYFLSVTLILSPCWGLIYVWAE